MSNISKKKVLSLEEQITLLNSEIKRLEEHKKDVEERTLKLSVELEIEKNTLSAVVSKLRNDV